MEAGFLRRATCRRLASVLSDERKTHGDHHVYTRRLHVSTADEPGRKPFASGDWFKGTPEEYGRQATTYFAYSGEFHVDEAAQKLTHSMFVSLFPNWVGQTQPRLVKIEGDNLYLSIASPVESSGRMVNAYLHWKRAAKT